MEDMVRFSLAKQKRDVSIYNKGSTFNESSNLQVNMQCTGVASRLKLCLLDTINMPHVSDHHRVPRTSAIRLSISRAMTRKESPRFLFCNEDSVAMSALSI
jgi:hypothetical protein